MTLRERANTNLRASISELEHLVTVFELMDMPKVKFRLLAIRAMLAAVDADMNNPDQRVIR